MNKTERDSVQNTFRSTATLSALAGATLLLSACFLQTSQDDLAAAPEFTAYARVAAPGTPVAGSFTIPGGTVIRESGPGINDEGKEMGECLSGGAWKNPAGHVTGSVPHTHCVSEGVEVVVTFAALANYVTPPSGNVQLNFSDCGEGEDPDCAHVHYKKNLNTTDGDGVLVGSGSDGSVWTVDLNQVDGTGNAFSGRSLTVTAASGSSSHALTLTW